MLGLGLGFGLGFAQAGRAELAEGDEAQRREAHQQLEAGQQQRLRRRRTGAVGRATTCRGVGRAVAQQGGELLPRYRGDVGEM